MIAASSRVALGVSAACLFALAAAAGRAEEKADQPRGRVTDYPPVLKDAAVETYKQIGDFPLKLYIFSPHFDKAAERRPAIVFFFGGGWRSGSPAQFQYQCRYLASRGMVAITADYRVSSRNNTHVVDCVRDAKSAVRWVREHAASLGVDPDRIVASGGSAGGHLAACTAVVEGIEHEGENTAISSRPNAMVLFNPAMSFAGPPAPNPKPEQAKAWQELIERLGVEASTISPASLVKPGAPPTLILFGSDDGLLVGGRQFADAMMQVGSRCELDVYEGQKHGFFNAGRHGENKYFRETLTSVDKFLASLGYLQGEPTVDEMFK